MSKTPTKKDRLIVFYSDRAESYSKRANKLRNMNLRDYWSTEEVNYLDSLVTLVHKKKETKNLTNF